MKYYFCPTYQMSNLLSFLIKRGIRVFLVIVRHVCLENIRTDNNIEVLLNK